MALFFSSVSDIYTGYGYIQPWMETLQMCKKKSKYGNKARLKTCIRKSKMKESTL